MNQPFGGIKSICTCDILKLTLGFQETVYFLLLLVPNHFKIKNTKKLTRSTFLKYILKSVTVRVPLTAPINGQIYMTSFTERKNPK